MTDPKSDRPSVLPETPPIPAEERKNEDKDSRSRSALLNRGGVNRASADGDSSQRWTGVTRFLIGDVLTVKDNRGVRHLRIVGYFRGRLTCRNTETNRLSYVRSYDPRIVAVKPVVNLMDCLRKALGRLDQAGGIEANE